jgi:hypothetical protein
VGRETAPLVPDPVTQGWPTIRELSDFVLDYGVRRDRSESKLGSHISSKRAEIQAIL